MTEFYNPYQFIPVTGKINGKPSANLAYRDIVEGKTNIVARHDLWQKDTVSGRLNCSITIQTPTFIGQTRTKEANENVSAEVDGYKRLVDGREVYILPGSSLRGMVGAVAEALSQSAMRVLEDRPLSVRKEVGQSLPALGRMAKFQEKEGYSIFALQPMTFATKWVYEQGYFRLPDHWHKHYKGRSLQKVLPVYLNGYRTVETGGKPAQAYDHNTFLGREKPTAFPVKGDSGSVFYYAKLYPELAQYKAEEEIPSKIMGLYVKSDKFLIGQKLLDNSRQSLLNESEYEALPAAQKDGYTKGVLRVLDVMAHPGNVPTTKKHELFIPWPDDLAIDGKKTRLFLMRKEVENTFNTLLKDTALKDEKMPILLKGYKTAKLAQDKLFYFDVDENGSICEISLSAIWRKRLPDSIHDFFKENGNEKSDLLPWNKHRHNLTPVEALWGVVENDKDQDTKSSRNLASRLRFSDGLPASGVSAENQVEAPVTLKILSSPKPPSPAMYFNDGSRKLIKKQELQAGKHQPNGRKVYLHQREQVNASKDKALWQTRDKTVHTKQKITICPLRVGQVFKFHIDFENISKAELGLLQASLQPGNSYLHKLGMGKPLGMGSVELKIEGLLLVDRLARYQLEGLDTPRYAKAWVCDGHEVVDAKQTGKLSGYHWDETLIDKSSRQNVQASGDPSKQKPHVSVTYPMQQGQEEETEGFQWFVNNTPSRYGDPPGEALGAIVNGKIPLLHFNEDSKNSGGRPPPPRNGFSRGRR
jgi:CRISPR-associated protein (TIGR03986 family)